MEVTEAYGKHVIEPFFSFGHSCYAQRQSVWALSDHSFVTTSGALVAINSQAEGGEVRFLPHLSCWKEVTSCNISGDKHFFAVCVKGYLGGDKNIDQGSEGGKSEGGTGGGDDGQGSLLTFDSAIIIYKLPYVEHDSSNLGPESHAAADGVNAVQVGSTAVIEAAVEVKEPRRARVILHKVDHESGDNENPPSTHLCSCAFSQDGKVLLVQSGFPDFTLHMYDWNRSKLLTHLSLEIEATAITFPIDASKSRICTSGPDHLCFWNTGAGARELKPLNPVKRLADVLDGDEVTDHAWLYDNERIVCTSKKGKVVVVNELEVVQVFRNSHEGEPINCVLAFAEGVTGAATTGDNDDVAGFLTMGIGGHFCVYHYCKNGDNSLHKTPYVLSQRFTLISSMPGPPLCEDPNEDTNKFMDVQSLSLGPDIGDACLLFCSTPSGVVTIDIGQLEAEVDKDSFDVARSSQINVAAAYEAESISSSGDAVPAPVASSASVSTSASEAGSSRKPGSKPISVGGDDAVPPPPQDDVETMPPLKHYINFNYVSRRHAGIISCISACTRKPYIATCSNSDEDSSVRIWNYKTRKVIFHKFFPGLQNPNAVSLHPSGNEILVGFDDNVTVFHITSGELRQACQVKTKCMMHVFTKDSEGRAQDKLIMNQDRVSAVKHSPDGGMFAVVTGKFVQIFSTYGAQVGGQPRRVNVLSGHAQSITAVHWNGDGLGLHTTDSGGFVYEWTAAKCDRIRENMVGRVNISAVGGSYNGGCLIATGGGARERARQKALERGENASKRVTLNAVGRPTMFNPQARLAIQKNRKKTAMQKRRATARSKDGGGGSSGSPTSAKRDGLDTGGIVGGSKDGRPVSTLVAWKDNIEDGCRVTRTVPGLVNRLLVTQHNCYDLTKSNYAFVMTSGGAVHTFDWGELWGQQENGGVPSRQNCGELAVHKGEITDCLISRCQNWLFTVGSDGCIVMSAINKKAKDSLLSRQGSLNTADEELALSNLNLEAESLERIREVEEKMKEERSHAEIKIRALESTREIATKEIREKMDKEVGRLNDEVVELKKSLDFVKGKSAMDALGSEKELERRIMEVEANYEKRIAVDAVAYLELKNAHDDLLVKAADDKVTLEEMRKDEVKRIADSWEQDKREHATELAELQAYASYVKDRYNEVMESNDLVHDEEVLDLRERGKNDVEGLQKRLKKSQAETNMMQRQNKVLRDTLDSRNLTNYELQEKIEEEKERNALMKAEVEKLAKELEKEARRADKWEVSCGEGKRQVTELEKIRKVLTHQLHEIRATIEPRDARLDSQRDKLSCLEGEYDKIVNFTTSIQKDAEQKSKRIGSLRETVRKQRNLVGDKETALANVVTQVNLSLMELRESGDWKKVDEVLKKVILPYLPMSKSDAIRSGISSSALSNQQKLREILTDKITSLERSLASTKSLAPSVSKVRFENRELMEQLNELRTEITERRRKEKILKNLLAQEKRKSATLT